MVFVPFSSTYCNDITYVGQDVLWKGKRPGNELLLILHLSIRRMLSIPWRKPTLRKASQTPISAAQECTLISGARLAF